jgi:arginyl-tRNA synthetase
MKEADVRDAIREALDKLGLSGADFSVELPELAFGDFATNAALIYGKREGKVPQELARLIATELMTLGRPWIKEASVAGPGFVNITLAPAALYDVLSAALADKDGFSKTDVRAGEKVMVEYTDPNPFKEFHIGHLMSNAVGESFSRLVENAGADVKRACYQGDTGLHVAKAIAHRLEAGAAWATVKDIGASYATGSRMSEEDAAFRERVVEVNKRIFDRADESVNAIYDEGRAMSLAYFDEQYRILGTSFDYFFYESQSGPLGAAAVKERVGTVFAESDGALVYRGEERDPSLHTRVFVNKEGLPTYEAKELGLAQLKADAYPYDRSIVITGNEVNDYFRVLLSAMSEVYPDLAARTEHHSHGMLRLTTGKMSSRTGDVITAESLINETATRVAEVMKESGREGNDSLARDVAVAAIKFLILKQAPGKDVIFDREKAIAFDGDSGPYLQYTRARINSLIRKGAESGFSPVPADSLATADLVRAIARFKVVAERAERERAPHRIATYLLDLAAAFNHFYNAEQVIVLGDSATAGRLAVAAAAGNVIERGLWLLGIRSPESM